MSDKSLIDEFADSYDDLDAELAEAYKEADHLTNNEAAEQIRNRLENILEQRLQTKEQK